MTTNNIVSLIQESIRKYYPDNIYDDRDYRNDLQLIDEGKYPNMTELRKHQNELGIKKIRVTGDNQYICLESMVNQKTVKLKYVEGVIYQVINTKERVADELVDKQKLDEIMNYLLND
ncbi:MAG TPA: hypothetical protein GXX41_02035 [Thermoanaerobacterium sp.]|nr:hypothetical protein [Thermoanaerobacterium sp.]